MIILFTLVRSFLSSLSSPPYNCISCNVSYNPFQLSLNCLFCGHHTSIVFVIIKIKSTYSTASSEETLFHSSMCTFFTSTSFHEITSNTPYPLECAALIVTNGTCDLCLMAASHHFHSHLTQLDDTLWFAFENKTLELLMQITFRFLLLFLLLLLFVHAKFRLQIYFRRNTATVITGAL